MTQDIHLIVNGDDVWWQSFSYPKSKLVSRNNKYLVVAVPGHTTWFSRSEHYAPASVWVLEIKKMGDKLSDGQEYAMCHESIHWDTRKKKEPVYDEPKPVPEGA